MLSFIISLLIAVLPACGTEDASNCYWDAAAQGNGFGTSFIDIAGHTITLK